MKSDFLIAVTQLAAERNLPREVVMGAVEAALVSAFKRDHLANNELAVRFGAGGEMRIFVVKQVVETVEDADKQIILADARKVRATAQVGEAIETETQPGPAGRIAAQTAKQVVMQRLRDAERDLVYAEYAGKEGEIVSGVVQRLEGRSVIIDLGRAEAVIPPQEQVSVERYRNGQRLKVYILEVGKTAKGPQIVASRSHKDLLRRLFALEVPEIFNGVVEIKSIAREPGFRSKVAVAATQERVDPVGSCVGLRGMRIQNIVNELHGEKIDVVEWVADAGQFVAKALGPAQVTQVILNVPAKIAIAVVPDRQLSLAIGREGQNARLAAKLTGWRIDIRSTSEAEAERLEQKAVAAPVPTAVAAAPVLVTATSPAVAKPVAPVTPIAPVPPKTPVAMPTPMPIAARAPEPARAAAPRAPTPAAREKAPEEAPLLAEALAKEETWQVPRSVSRSPIRFAEDIMEYRGGGRGRRKGRGGTDQEEVAKKPKKGGGRVTPRDLTPEEP